MPATTNTVTTITRRLEPCNCGCQGDDPWHARTFHRQLLNVQEQTGRCAVHAYGLHRTMPFRAVAWARLPWGEGKLVRVVEVVLRHDGREQSLGWFSTPEVA